jgi:hypothetical protein
MRTVIGIAICAVLFVIYGLLRNHGCAGHCTGCTNSCERSKGLNHHV